MNKNHELKQAVVNSIVEKLESSKTVMVVGYSKLTVETDIALRKACREANVQYCVLKNRLVNRALEAKKIEGLESLLEGPNAFVFSEDAVAGPKVIHEFIEKNKLTALEIRGGLLEGKVVDVKTIKALATMPSREVLLARLVGSMSATVGSFVRVIEAIRKQKAGE